MHAEASRRPRPPVPALVPEGGRRRGHRPGPAPEPGARDRQVRAGDDPRLRRQPVRGRHGARSPGCWRRRCPTASRRAQRVLDGRHRRLVGAPGRRRPSRPAGNGRARGSAYHRRALAATPAARCSVNLQDAMHLRSSPPMTAAQARLWLQKWRWYQRTSLPWNRARLHWELAERECFARLPLHGQRPRGARRGAHRARAPCLLEPGVWITVARRRARANRDRDVPEPRRHGRRRRPGRDRRPLHAGQRLLRHRRQPPLRRPRRPITWQGFTSKGPTRIGDNGWLGRTSSSPAASRSASAASSAPTAS